MRLLPVKIRVLLLLATVLLAALSTVGQDAQGWSLNNSPLPAPTGFVNDYAGVIDEATRQQLETKIENLKNSTNPAVELAVAVVRTTGDRQIFDYSLAVARGWKIGSKADDNPSALLLVAIDDRKYFTQVSKDLEDELPDGIVGSLQRQHLVPEFRKGNYAKGIADTVDAYIAAIQNKSIATPTPEQAGAGTQRKSALGFPVICCGIIVLIFLVMIFSKSKGGRNGGDRGGWGGGGFGGSGGGGSALPWIIGGLLAGSGNSGGSSSSSDWGSGSSGGWGGFGGGGDFGGGGGGGDW